MTDPATTETGLRLRRVERIAWRNIAGEVLVIHPGRGSMYPLNPAASLVWESLDGRLDARALARRVCGRFDVDEATALKDVTAFLAELKREGLAED